VRSSFKIEIGNLDDACTSRFCVARMTHVHLYILVARRNLGSAQLLFDPLSSSAVVYCSCFMYIPCPLQGCGMWEGFGGWGTQSFHRKCMSSRTLCLLCLVMSSPTCKPGCVHMFLWDPRPAHCDSKGPDPRGILLANRVACRKAGR
jgi:hypothetical protein